MTLKLGVERKPSYYNIVCVTFGTRGAKLVELFIVLLMLGACVGYIAIIGGNFFKKNLEIEKQGDGCKIYFNYCFYF